MMHKWFISLLASAMLLFTATVANSVTMPWSKFSEAAKDSVSAFGTMCASDTTLVEVFTVKLVHPNGDEYIYWASLDTQKLVVAYYPSGASMPAEIGTGTLYDDERNDVIPPLRWEPFDPGKHVTPCQHLVAEQA